MDMAEVLDEHLLELTKKVLAANARIAELEAELAQAHELLKNVAEANRRLAETASGPPRLALNSGSKQE